LFTKCGNWGEAMLPNGSGTIVQVDSLAYGGNSKGAAFATAEWYFAVDMDMS
jgi:hypothetical protein